MAHKANRAEALRLLDEDVAWSIAVVDRAARHKLLWPR